MGARHLAFVADLTREGVHPRKVRRAVDAGDLVLHGNGLVSTPEAASDGDFQWAAVALFTDGGILCRRTAAMRHGLTSDLPPATEVLVRDGIRRVSSPFPIQPFRSKIAESFTAGVETSDILGIRVGMTDRARTVADLWRSHRHAPAPTQFQQEALNAYLSEGGDVDAPIRHARLFDEAAARRIGIAVETFLSHPSRTF